MNIGVGSKNKTKVEAVERVLADYPMFAGAKAHGVAVEIDDFGHPRNIQETVDGATERAKQAFIGNDYGFGIEGGLMEVPGTKSGFVEVAVCAIYDGEKTHLGLSPSFEWPKKAIEGILEQGLDGSQAMKAAGLTEEKKIGESGGVIRILTNGRMDRTEFNALAIRMALIHLENPGLF
jgi:inosine/xanthosine triphosphatase